jgi:hypothetical protein
MVDSGNSEIQKEISRAEQMLKKFQNSEAKMF